MGGLVKDDLGTVRSGWVLATFGVIAGVVYFGLMLGVSLLGLYPKPPLTLDDWHLTFTSSAILFAALAATFVCRLGFRAEAGLARPAARRLGLGLLLGGGAIALCTLAPVLAGTAHPAAGAATLGTALVSGLLQLCAIGPTSVGEEILLRGVALRQLRRGTNAVVAVAATGSMFGVLHLGNPSASPIAALNVALVGLWFGAVVVRTGSLWTSIGMHLAWNWCEGFVFGVPVSGVQPGASLLSVGSPPGPFWSGGDFGPEAAGVTSLVLGLATAVTIFWPRRESPNPPNR